MPLLFDARNSGRSVSFPKGILHTKQHRGLEEAYNVTKSREEWEIDTLRMVGLSGLYFFL